MNGEKSEVVVTDVGDEQDGEDGPERDQAGSEILVQRVVLREDVVESTEHRRQDDEGGKRQDDELGPEQFREHLGQTPADTLDRRRRALYLRSQCELIPNALDHPHRGRTSAFVVRGPEEEHNAEESGVGE
jgi:hypothetical protein